MTAQKKKKRESNVFANKSNFTPKISHEIQTGNLTRFRSITCDVVENCFPTCLTAETVNLENIFEIKNSFLFCQAKLF